MVALAPGLEPYAVFGQVFRAPVAARAGLPAAALPALPDFALPSSGLTPSLDLRLDLDLAPGFDLAPPFDLAARLDLAPRLELAPRSEFAPAPLARYAERLRVPDKDVPGWSRRTFDNMPRAEGDAVAAPAPDPTAALAANRDAQDEEAAAEDDAVVLDDGAPEEPAAARPEAPKTAWAKVRAFGADLKDLVRGDAALKRTLKPYRARMTFTAALLVADAVLGIGIGYLIGPILDTGALAAAEGLAAHAAKLAWMSGGLVAMVAAFAVIQRAHTFWQRKLNLLASRDFRVALYKNLLESEMTFHGKQRSGALANRLLEDSGMLAGKNVEVRLSFLYYLVYFAFGAGMLLYVHPLLALVALSVVPVLSVVGGKFGARWERLEFKIFDKKADLLRHGQEVFAQVDTVKSLGTREVEVERFGKKAQELAELGEQDARLQADYNAVSTSATSFFAYYLLFILGSFVIAASMGLTYGQLIQVTLFAGLMKVGIEGLAGTYLSFKQYSGGTKVFRRLLAREPRIRDAEDATVLDPVRGEIAFEDVDFSYGDDKTKKALSGVSFTLAPGRSLAVVGESGSGKSTVARLLLRLWQTDAGRVTVDGVDVKDVSFRRFLRRVAVVPQQAPLFGGTIRGNMTYGLDGVSEERLAAAIAAAQADFVFDAARFPRGLDTEVSEGGARLSGGEKQRVAIVRALLRDPAILILDEATSALDARSKRAVEEALRALENGPTTIMVTHDPSAAARADNILVLERGAVVEYGTHAELLARDGAYAALVRHAGQDKNTSAAGQFAAAAVFAAAAAVAWLTPLPPPALAAVAGLFLFPVPAFLAAAMAALVAQRRAGRSWKRAAFAPIASARRRSAAFARLPERYRSFLALHEDAHARRGVGEIRATLAQVAGAGRLYLENVRAWGRTAARAAATARNFFRGDREVAEHLKPYRGKIALIMGALFLESVLWAANAWAVGTLLDVAVSAAETGIAAQLSSMLWISGGVVAGFAAIIALHRLSTLWKFETGARLGRDLRVALQRKLLKKPMRFHMDNASGALATRLNKDVDYLVQKNVEVRLPLLTEIFFIGLSGALMLFTSVPVSVLVFGLIPVLAVASAVIGHFSERVYTVFLERYQALGSHAQEVLGQIQTVKAFGAEEHEAARFKEKADALEEIGARDAKLGANAAVFTGALSEFFTEYLIYILGAWAIATAFGLSLGMITAMTFYTGFIRESIARLSEKWLQYKQAHGATKVSRGWLGEPEAKPAAQVVIPPHAQEGRVAFEEVTFTYRPDDGGEPTLRDVSFEVRPGETVAFVGGSGSGKSTLLRLLTRLWEPQRGRVSVDGIRVSDFKEGNLESMVGIVGQEPKLFDDTLRYNLTYGAGRAIADAELEAAVEAAGASFLYDRELFPEGLDTAVGEGGGRLSGGQKQRISIVRALLKRPRILILDEPTSALDKATAAGIWDTLDRLSSGAGLFPAPTTLLVTHDLKMAGPKVDRIIVLDEGRVVERGTHAQLLVTRGVYYRLWRRSPAADGGRLSPSS